MSETLRYIIIIFLIFGVTVPIAFLILKIAFKNSVLVKIGITLIVLLSIITVLIRVTTGQGLVHAIWLIPLILISLFLSILYIKNILVVPLKNIEKTIHEISHGNLDVFVNHAYIKRKDELGAIAKNTNKMARSMDHILEKIHDVASSINETGQALNSDSQRMSGLANEQASSVEEISASMEEMSASIEQNTELSRNAEKIAKKSAVKIGVNDKNVQKTVEALSTIVKKVEVISDIAFQTNVLSLNAAIEAAKAGKYGKGFNVVANEIRKLSRKSKEAALDIEKISKSSISTATRTGRISKQIVPDIKKTARFTKQISNSSREQNANSTQVSGSIQELTGSTQQFAEAFQNIANNAEKLKKMSETLVENISFFNQDNQNEIEDGKIANQVGEIIENKNNTQENNTNKSTDDGNLKDKIHGSDELEDFEMF